MNIKNPVALALLALCLSHTPAKAGSSQNPDPALLESKSWMDQQLYRWLTEPLDKVATHDLQARLLPFLEDSHPTPLRLASFLTLERTAPLLGPGPISERANYWITSAAELPLSLSLAAALALVHHGAIDVTSPTLKDLLKLGIAWLHQEIKKPQRSWESQFLIESRLILEQSLGLAVPLDLISHWRWHQIKRAALREQKKRISAIYWIKDWNPHELNSRLCQRLLHSDPTHLDLWQIQSTHQKGCKSRR